MSIRRKQRKSFEKYFEHANSRVREYAQQVAEQVEESRARIRSDEYQPPVSTPDDDVEPWVWDPVYEEAVPWTETYFPMTAPPPDPDRSTAERRLAFDDDDDIPF